MERSLWKSNTGFLLAAIGSAIGLGNIWKFSYMCHKNGGFAFLIPYTVALLTTGIPVMILEFAIGHKMRASAPKAMHMVNKEWEWLGWYPVLFVMFGIDLFYVVVIAWCGLYMLFSLKAALPWEGHADGFFYQEFLGLTDGVFHLGGVRWPILIMAVVLWAVMWAICVRRVDRGVELACKIFMPVLLVLTVVLVAWGLTLDGAMEGLKQYLKPDLEEGGIWEKLGDVQVWRDAFGQIFFSLSIGFGIMIAYASYLPKKTDLVRNAFITCIVNCSYSVFAGVAVFSVLGYMAQASGQAVADVAKGGPGLCFVVYPEAISLLPRFNSTFGFLFFLTLVLAGLTSAISILEAFASAAMDKFGWRRTTTVTFSCLLGMAGSTIFVTGAGLYWLDILSHFIDTYGLLLVGLLECLLIVWYYKIDKLHFHLTDANEGGYSKIWDVWWEWSIKYVAPTALFVVLAWSIAEDFLKPYEGYSGQELIAAGAAWMVGFFLLSGLFSVYTKHRGGETKDL